MNIQFIESIEPTKENEKGQEPLFECQMSEQPQKESLIEYKGSIYIVQQIMTRISEFDGVFSIRATAFVMHMDMYNKLRNRPIPGR